MIERYTLPEMGVVWSQQNKFQKWLDVEIAVCEVHAEDGTIPRKAVEEIKAKAAFTPERILEIEKTTDHDVIAFTTNLAENIGEAARFVHYGLTSSDVVDTANAILLKESCDICYLGNLVCALGLIYSIIVVATDKVNRLPRFHAFQSIFLTVASIIISIPLYIIMFVGVFVDASIGLPIISGLVSLVCLVFGLAVLFFVVMAAIKAYGGEFYKIPVIGNFAEKYAG